MKIMVAFDGSDVAKRALGLAKEHAMHYKNAVLFIVTSLHGAANEQLNSLEMIEQNLSRVKTECEDDHIPCEIEVLSQGTTAGEALLDFAEKNKIDEIVIGIQRKSKVGKILFGSTAQYVILHSGCPVVTIH